MRGEAANEKVKLVNCSGLNPVQALLEKTPIHAAA